MRKSTKSLSTLPPMDDDQMAGFWDKHDPEEFEGWREGDLDFRRPPKKLIQLRLDPRDVRIIDRESKRSGIDRAQLIRSWVKERINQMQGS
ncbi:MAG: hypothetical protein AB1512_12605 [Thermodesulfobacteriota bacterium]